MASTPSTPSGFQRSQTSSGRAKWQEQVSRDPLDEVVTTPMAESATPRPDRPEDPKTQSSTRGSGDPKSKRESSARASAGKKVTRQQMGAPIVPAGSVTGKSLILVIAIMCCLACLTAGAVYMIHQSAQEWRSGISSEITVQVEPQALDKPDVQPDVEVVLKEVEEFVKTQKGIDDVRIVPLTESASLLEPWLGKLDVLGKLQIPRLIAVKVQRDPPADIKALEAALEQKFKGVTLDDHRRWLKQIKTVTNSFAIGGLAILFLVASATIAVIISATRSALLSNREIVEVLHFVGATDQFIANQFAKHFFRLGILAGLVGAVAAIVIFFILPTVVDIIGGSSFTQAQTQTQMQNFIGQGGLGLAGYAIIASVVGVIAGLCMLTSRYGVSSILKSQR